MTSSPTSLCAGFDPKQLYRKYDPELRTLSRKLRGVYHNLQAQGYGTTFGDVEGELVYMLVRESRPASVFEISPDCGWSTNYLLAALTANKYGVLHSFELEQTKHGRPTEGLIRGNQHPDWDQSQLILHLGNAVDTVPRVGDEINFLLIDSCHEDWFARWYIEQVFPRTNGVAFVQDIAFCDGLEPSSEAEYVWNWAKQQKLNLFLVGSFERQLQTASLRDAYSERRGLRCNSVSFSLPSTDTGQVPAFKTSPDSLLDEAERATGTLADELATKGVRQILPQVDRVSRHRSLHRAGLIYLRLQEPGEAERQFQRALGAVVLSDKQQRAKGIVELFKLFLSARQWRFASQAALFMCFSRRDGVPILARTLWEGMGRLVRRGRR